jgi:hypothetical protein
MRRFNVVVSDKAGEILDKFKKDTTAKSLDEALDNLLIASESLIA